MSRHFRYPIFLDRVPRPARCAVLVVALAVLSACSLQQAPPTATPTNTPTVAVPNTPVPTIGATPAFAITPTATPEPAPSIPRAFAGGENRLFVRETPSLLSRISRVVNDLAGWRAVGRTEDNLWLQVEFDDGSSGWIVYLPDVHEVDIESLEVTGESELVERAALIRGGDAVLYDDSGERTNTTIERLSAVEIDGRSSDGEWLHVAGWGWIRNERIALAFAVEDVPEMAFDAPVLVAQVDVTEEATEVADEESSEEVETNAVVKLDSGGLRLRQFPSTEATILLNLTAGTPLRIDGRTTDNTWVLVKLREGYEGWTSAHYINFEVDLDSVPLIEDPQPVAFFTPPTPEGGFSVTTNVTGGARNVFLRGQQMGNRPNIFTTVGDSLTDTPYFLRHIVYGYDLRDYGYLLPVIQFFNSDTGQGNAFARRAISTHAGWSTFSVLEEQSMGGLCQPGEVALACEYRVTRPAYAIIMIGTNDAPAFPGDTYRANMSRILQITVDNGVVPILSTLPPRAEFNERIIEYNQVLLDLARTYDVPVIDLYSALINLPNRGLSADGIHLSIPPGAPASTMVFSAENLQYGTTVRNLTALQALERVRSLTGY